MKKRGLALAIALAVGAGGSAAAEPLLVGNEGTYPPFSMVSTSGDLTGIEPELAREMCKRMEAECEFVVMDFKALIPSLVQGKLDMVASQIKPLPERKERTTFGMPFIYNYDSFVVPADSDYTFTAEGLEGVKIGVQRGSSQAKYINETFGDAVEPVYFDNPDQIQLDLLSGRIDMTFGAKLNWTRQLIDTDQGEGWKLAGGDYWTGDPSIPEDERGSSWIVQKGNTELIEKMDAALSSMLEDCTFTQIREQYISVAITPAEAACVDKSS
jgi:ABC-type amino acid transport substrate-binding protein